MGFKAVGAQVTITSPRDRHLLEGIEPGFGFKLSLERQTPLFEEQNIRLAVLEEFFLKIKHVPFPSESIVPTLEFVAVLDGHAVGHVIMLVG